MFNLYVKLLNLCKKSSMYILLKIQRISKINKHLELQNLFEFSIFIDDFKNVFIFKYFKENRPHLFPRIVENI